MPRIQGSNCPSCGKFLDGASSVSDPGRSGPSPGDLSICIACGTIVKFGENLKLEIVSENELEQIKQNFPTQWRILNYTRNMICSRNN